MATEKDGKVTLSIEELRSLIQPAQGKPAGSPDEQYDSLVAAMKGTDRPALPQEEVECRSERTGAKFRAVIVKSRAFKDGRVVRLEGYTIPEGSDKTVAEGGTLPDGMPRYNPDGSKTAPFKQYLWSEFYQRDLRDFVGRPLPAHARVDVQQKAAAQPTA